jgi:hypothetical protein
VFKEGLLNQNDDGILAFVTTQRDYENIRFALADASAIAFVDLLTRIKADPKFVDQINAARNNALSVINAAQGVMNGK